MVEEKNGEQKKYFIITHGCQMNVYDSEVLAGHMENMGYSPAQNEEDADVLVVNTCAVRKKAEEKIYSRLGKLKRLKEKKPGMLMILWGCMVQQKGVAEKIRNRFSFLDLIGGPHSLGRFPELVEEIRLSKETILSIEENGEREHLPVKRGHRFKAWVPISHGCNNYCTYCVVPYVRGREKSRPPELVIAEVEFLAKEGYKEITLLGQNVNSYGKDLGGGIDFAELLITLDSIEGLAMIRFMTSHPKDFSDKIIQAIKEGKKICEHIHLPLQAGSNKILKLMNRGYTREYYLELVSKIKTTIPGASITTDLIVGFPGEEEKDFEDTIDMVKRIQFDAAYTFVFSPRKGTRAAVMETQVPQEVKKRRIVELNNVQNEISKKKNLELVDTVQEVLVEGKSKTDPNMFTGRTRTNKIVHFSCKEDLTGQLVNVRITEARAWNLMGEVKT